MPYQIASPLREILDDTNLISVLNLWVWKSYFTCRSQLYDQFSIIDNPLYYFSCLYARLLLIIDCACVEDARLLYWFTGRRLIPWIEPVSVTTFHLLFLLYTDEKAKHNDVWRLKIKSRDFYLDIKFFLAI